MPAPLTMTKTINGFGRLFTRAFHATPVTCTKHSKKRLQEMLDGLPPYPHPIQRTFKQSWFGLYGGKHIQFGNNVPESEYKTRRFWLPNVKQKKLYSESLGRFVSVRVVASVLRTIDKVGGLDNYLTSTKTARMKELGPMGWKLRWEVMTSRNHLKKRAAELEAMGLSAEGAEVSIRQQVLEEARPAQLEESAHVKKQKQQAPGLEMDAVGETML